MTGIPTAALETARNAGAHDDCIAFIEEYPESNAGTHIRSCYEYDDMESAAVTGGGFFKQLWNGGAKEAYGAADETNTLRLEHLFSEDAFTDLPNPYRPAPSR